jgi:isoleucyl-tRNA synthetase
MSKSKGNVVKPMDVVKLHGADALRWYCYTSAPPGSVRRFDIKMVADINRQVMLTLWNVYSFFVMYANIDNYQPDPAKTTTEVPELDLWILSELNQLITDVDSSLETYNPTGAARKIEEFVDMLSNWYVRRSRRRFWKSESDTDKLSAYNTLYHCLVTVSKLIAPFMPYLAEEMYQNLVCSVDKNAPISVHLADFPVADTGKVNKDLSADTQLAMKVCSLGRAARSQANVKVRQPLGQALIRVNSVRERDGLIRIMPQILEELNVKTLAFTDKVEELNMPDLCVSMEGEVSVAVPRNVSPELAEEGLAREIVHRLQTMRKTAGFEIADYIVTYYQGDDYVKQVMTNYTDYVKLETLSRSLIEGKPEEGVVTETFKLNDHAVVLGVKKV